MDRLLCRFIVRILLFCLLSGPALAASPEYQIKAVFLFNFSQFVDWPPRTFERPESPLVIGILGDDPFGGFIDEAVRGEKSHDRTIAVYRYRRVEDVTACQILFISRSEANRLDAVLGALKGKSILSVSDIDSFALRGGMIRFINESNKIRFRINVEAARAAELTISSKLLRPAQIEEIKKE